MASSIKFGFDGYVTFGAPYAALTTHLTRWRAKMRREVEEYITFGQTSPAKSTAVGVYSLSGSAEGYLDDVTQIGASAGATQGDATVLGEEASAALVLAWATGRTLSFSAHCTRIRQKSSKVKGLNVLAFDFISDGNLTTA